MWSASLLRHKLDTNTKSDCDSIRISQTPFHQSKSLINTYAADNYQIPVCKLCKKALVMHTYIINIHIYTSSENIIIEVISKAAVMNNDLYASTWVSDDSDDTEIF